MGRSRNASPHVDETPLGLRGAPLSRSASPAVGTDREESPLRPETLEDVAMKRSSSSASASSAAASLTSTSPSSPPETDHDKVRHRLSDKPKPKSTASGRPAARTRNSMNGPLYMQTINNKVIIRRAKRKGDGPVRSLARWLLDNQVGFAFNLIALLFLAHVCMSKARPYTGKFFALSHYNPHTGRYATGLDDLYFIAFCIILFTGLRAVVMEHVLAPLAKWLGIAKKKDITRFSEQAWLLVYYLFFWNLGMYLYSNSSYFLNLKNLWTNWPDRELDGLTKAYMLGQWAFWLQQVLVINMEERRKDHWQMMTHHFITIALVSSCYAYHFTRIGNLILVLMDVVDLFFPLAKCLKYLGYQKLCDVIFGLFMVSWLMARHIFYLMTCWSIIRDVSHIIPTGCFTGAAHNLTGPSPVPNDWAHVIEPFLDGNGTICFNDNVKWAFFSTLLFLQVITIAWFYLIVGVAVRVIKGQGTDDPRSDDEAVEEEVDEYEYEEAHPLEEEVGVEAIDLKNWERRTGVKRPSASSGVSLPGHSDRKELLNRIGCEKQVN